MTYRIVLVCTFVLLVAGCGTKRVYEKETVITEPAKERVIVKEPEKEKIIIQEPSRSDTTIVVPEPPRSDTTVIVPR